MRIEARNLRGTHFFRDLAPPFISLGFIKMEETLHQYPSWKDNPAFYPPAKDIAEYLQDERARKMVKVKGKTKPKT